MEEYQNLFKDVVNNIPQEKLQPNSAGGDILGWGFHKWGELFNKRQLNTLIIFCDILNSLFYKVENDYQIAIKSYLAIGIGV